MSGTEKSAFRSDTVEEQRAAPMAPPAHTVVTSYEQGLGWLAAAATTGGAILGGKKAVAKLFGGGEAPMRSSCHRPPARLECRLSVLRGSECPLSPQAPRTTRR